MITLPEAFEQEMKQLLGEEEYEAYRKTFDEAVHRGLRVNNGKISTEEFLRRTDIPLKKVPWINWVSNMVYPERRIPRESDIIGSTYTGIAYRHFIRTAVYRGEYRHIGIVRTKPKYTTHRIDRAYWHAFAQQKQNRFAEWK